MKTLEKDQDKIQKISDQLRKEVIEPAQIESAKIIEEAKLKACKIQEDAENQAEKLIYQAKEAIVKEKNVFQSSLEQAAKQTLEKLRQTIEHKLFNDQLAFELNKETTKPDVVADLIKALIEAISKEGINSDLAAVVAKTASVESINFHLAKEILKKLENETVILGDFLGGVKLKITSQKLTIDVSDETLKELLSNYIRKDFRQLFFSA